MNKIAKSVLALIIVFLPCFIIVSCSGKKDIIQTTANNANDLVSQHEAALFNQHLVDSAVAMLRTGDIVLRRGIGADSYLLAMMNQKNKTYSHCGIVIINDGHAYIYHSIGGEDNPDQRLRKDPAAMFFSPLHNTGLAVVRYDYGQDEINRLRIIVERYYRRRPKFDMKFDLATDDQLYCSEFVYKAINEATKDATYIRTSFLSGKPYVGIDDLFINPHAHVIWQTEFKQYLCNQK